VVAGTNAYLDDPCDEHPDGRNCETRCEVWRILTAAYPHMAIAVLNEVRSVFVGLICEHCAKHGPGVIDYLTEPYYGTERHPCPFCDDDPANHDGCPDTRA